MPAVNFPVPSPSCDWIPQWSSKLTTHLSSHRCAPHSNLICASQASTRGPLSSTSTPRYSREWPPSVRGPRPLPHALIYAVSVLQPEVIASATATTTATATTALCVRLLVFDLLEVTSAQRFIAFRCCYWTLCVWRVRNAEMWRVVSLLARSDLQFSGAFLAITYDKT